MPEESLKPAPGNGEAGEPRSFEAKAVGGKKGVWKFTLLAEALALEASDGSESHEIARTDAPEKIQLQKMPFGGDILVVQIPKKVIFRLEPDSAAFLKDWLGPPTIRDLKIALKGRLKWCLPIGILFILSAMPSSGDPATGLAPIPFDPLSLVLGAVLIAVVLLMRVWPCRALFLADATWFLMLAGQTVYKIVIGASSYWWGLAVALILVASKSAFAEYRRFASLRQEQADRSQVRRRR